MVEPSPTWWIALSLWVWEVPKLSPCSFCCCFSECLIARSSELSVDFAHRYWLPFSAQMHLTIDLFPSNKTWPLQQKAYRTSAMFCISRKCFPAKHRKLDGFWSGSHFFFCRISYNSNTVQNWITHHPNPTSAVFHLLERITGRIGLQQMSHWAQEVDPLCKFFEAPGNYVKNVRKKGVLVMNIIEGKYLGGLQHGFRSYWRFQSLVLLERLGHELLWFRACHGENL